MFGGSSTGGRHHQPVPLHCGQVIHPLSGKYTCFAPLHFGAQTCHRHAVTIGHVDQPASPDDRVLISDDGSYRFLTIEDAERRLQSMPSRTCPRCDGARQVQIGGAIERCAQCQGVGRVVWAAGSAP